MVVKYGDREIPWYNKKSHPGQEYFSQKKDDSNAHFPHPAMVSLPDDIRNDVAKKKQLTIGGKNPPKVNDNKLAFRRTDGKPNALVTLCSYRKDVSQICVHIPVSMKI